MDRLPKVILAWLMISAVVAMVLYPAASGSGSFQAVNGPTAVFQGLRAALLVLWLVVVLGTTISSLMASSQDVGVLDQQTQRVSPLLC